MRVFLAAVVLLALCVLGLCIGILLRKDGRFPDTEIENNAEMKKLGIKCVKAEEMERWRREHGRKASCSGESGCASCAGCAFHNKD